MFASLRGPNGRRHDVDFLDDPVTVDVAMSTTTVQITMTATGPGNTRCAGIRDGGGSGSSKLQF